MRIAGATVMRIAGATVGAQKPLQTTKQGCASVSPDLVQN